MDVIFLEPKQKRRYKIKKLKPKESDEEILIKIINDPYNFLFHPELIMKAQKALMIIYCNDFNSVFPFTQTPEMKEKLLGIMGFKYPKKTLINLNDKK